MQIIHLIVINYIIYFHCRFLFGKLFQIYMHTTFFVVVVVNHHKSISFLHAHIKPRTIKSKRRKINFIARHFLYPNKFKKVLFFVFSIKRYQSSFHKLYFWVSEREREREREKEEEREKRRQKILLMKV
jgi:hypothetical protein